jgi:hypothetical protein
MTCHLARAKLYTYSTGLAAAILDLPFSVVTFEHQSKLVALCSPFNLCNLYQSQKLQESPHTINCKVHSTRTMRYVYFLVSRVGHLYCPTCGHCSKNLQRVCMSWQYSSSTCVVCTTALRTRLSGADSSSRKHHVVHRWYSITETR